MKFNPITGRPERSYAVDKAEVVYATNTKWLAETNPIYTVHCISESETAFTIQTNYCYVICSKKFFSVAKQIKNYLEEVTDAKGQVGIPLLMLTGFNDKGYVTYEFGYDDEEEFTCYPVVKHSTDTFLHVEFHAELKPRTEWTNNQTDCVTRDEEVAIEASKTPDPSAPTKQKRSGVTRKKPASAT